MLYGLSYLLGVLKVSKSCKTVQQGQYYNGNTFDILNWVELSTRRKIHKCVLVFKCLNNLVPEYLSGYFTRNSSIHSYNTRSKNNLHLPKPNLSLGRRSFIYSGSLLYNNLPDEIKNAVSLTKFKSLVQRHSF